MPPPLPDRYRLEVRLGRDEDVEEWLATDTSLDRPVLVRLVGPEVDPMRRAAFLAAVRAAAGVNHTHLASVFTAGEVPGGAYAVTEWTGGMTLADRLASNQTMEVDEFLPNAAGLADALAALHAEGIVHGAIDTRAIFYALAHPAKLGAFGRATRSTTAAGDVRDLAEALERALTGTAPGGPPPSELVDGLSPEVDRALRTAREGTGTARTLADGLRAAPSPAPPTVPTPGWSRRLLVVAIVLVVAAVALVGVGRLFLVEGAGETEDAAPTSTLAGDSTPLDATLLDVVQVSTLDPYGDGTENDDTVAALVDGDPSTAWRTERYPEALPDLKPGVGVRFRIDGTPSTMEIVGMTAGTAFEIGWAPERAGVWELVTAGQSAGGPILLQLPERTGGSWRLWLTDLPADELGDHAASIAEVRFRR
jgi:hypothetical protein